MRRTAAVAGVAALAAAFLTACSDGDDASAPEGTLTATPRTSAPASGSPSDEGDPGPPEVVGTIASGLAVPWGVGFLPNGDAVVTERDTRRVLLLEAPTYDERQVGVISAAVPLGDQGGEAGLPGVAVSPDFAEDQMLYFYLSTATDNRIVKATLEEGRLGAPEVILDGIPNGFIHDGGRLAFGPDGYLYASTGETGQGELAQDRSTLAGKILRITTDGDPAPGNPDPDSPIWSHGHRNEQGLAFDDAGNLWASEFGANTFDELNLVEGGDNYGWPHVEGRGDDPALTDPQVVWDTSEASPSGLTHLDGRLWLAALRGKRLWRVDVAGGRASNPTDFFVGRYGRLRTVVVAPDGNLWVTTSNRDGRGAPGPRDDLILVVEP